MTTEQHLDLDPIDARHTAATDGPWEDADATDSSTTVIRAGSKDLARVSSPADAKFIAHARADVEALIAEVRRLRAELAIAIRPSTPRLCICGHSNQAHTVPAPHSCFAHGQTCPCPAYRQLPHDEAEEQLKRNLRAAEERALEQESAVVSAEAQR